MCRAVRWCGRAKVMVNVGARVRVCVRVTVVHTLFLSLEGKADNLARSLRLAVPPSLTLGLSESACSQILRAIDQGGVFGA